ncbi:uncharacterized protein TRIADDRAFT_22252 [Trichoplax adhaerens]|uniref:Arb2 domain-containing protein n=1 Tax=Trichoplax adhaerens TaxID=10228 RepID=B3RRB3_TRIAD|nr:hypothetical protein TRIADDRAFT_22252 [Trichoplax adhaerens]EDV26313.1 hypothetical protein TRIADDRAFT_22252 [Trichoplax adhaerens]|eukprot:XP_002110309.1 hypothetical protein TRIADDRAFT_22252 [Trichoplax adhaerens]
MILHFQDQYEQNFPSTLEGFGYKFDEDGELRNINSNSPFVFDVSSSGSYNQKRYEALGEVIEKYVYELLVKDCHLEKITLPVDHKKDEPTNFIFVSDDAKTNREKLMILIHGSGVVRAGQWARRLIINDSLESGTQIPYIKRAQQVCNSYKTSFDLSIFNKYHKVTIL